MAKRGKPENPADDDNGRGRPIPPSMVPPDDQLKRVTEICDRAEAALCATLQSIDQLEHPIARGRAVTRILASLKQIGTDLRVTRKIALIQAYERGQAESGWYGYGAIAGQVGISTSRACQIIHGKKPGQSTAANSTVMPVEKIRSIRKACTLLKEGHSRAHVARATGLTPGEVRKLAEE